MTKITAQSLAENSASITNEELYAFLLLNLRKLHQQTMTVNSSIRVPEDGEIKTMKASSSKAIKYLLGLRALIGLQPNLDQKIDSMLGARKNLSGSLSDVSLVGRQVPDNVRQVLSSAYNHDDLSDNEIAVLKNLKKPNDDVLEAGLANLRAVLTDKTQAPG